MGGLDLHLVFTDKECYMLSQRVREQGMVKLCATQGCCPTVDFTDKKKVILRDDFGGKVQLTRKHWRDLKAKFSLKSK